jgi:hypothetical protein
MQDKEGEKNIKLKPPGAWTSWTWTQHLRNGKGKTKNEKKKLQSLAAPSAMNDIRRRQHPFPLYFSNEVQLQ